MLLETVYYYNSVAVLRFNSLTHALICLEIPHKGAYEHLFCVTWQPLCYFLRVLLDGITAFDYSIAYYFPINRISLFQNQCNTDSCFVPLTEQLKKWTFLDFVCFSNMSHLRELQSEYEVLFEVVQ